MKVVLFCGGLGARLRDYSEQIPKPLVEIGSRPVLWHLMRYYAHYGHTEFVLCLGHKGTAIKSYFRNYDECLSNDFVYERGGKQIELLQSDIERLEDHLRRHRPALEHRRAPAARAQAPRDGRRCSSPTTPTG